MDGLSALDWTALAIGAVGVGFAKTAIGGVATISVALFAAVLPARESTGALLPLLITGDLLAVGAYRRHARWGVLLRLFPSVAVGVAVGTVFVALVDDTTMRRTIGAVLLGLLGVHLWVRRRSAPPVIGRTATAGAGWLAGFTTMVANAGGAVMSLYLLSARVGMLGFLGTGAWFFFLVNLFKLPFSAGLGLITPASLAMNAVLVPAVVAGGLVGRRVIHRIDESRFEHLVLLFTALAAANLLR